jgi:hypothetical protein
MVKEITEFNDVIENIENGTISGHVAIINELESQYVKLSYFFDRQYRKGEISKEEFNKKMGSLKTVLCKYGWEE